jgi:hypothetical protein
MRTRILILAVVVIAGIGGAILLSQSRDPEGFRQPTPTAPPLSATVGLSYPPDGSILYAESVPISGFASAPQNFRVELVDLDGTPLAAGMVQSPGGDWSLELAHQYRGDPTEATVRVRPMTGDGEYDRTTIVLDQLQNRPEGVFGLLSLPQDGDTVGGDAIQIEGRASGTLTVRLRLLADDGAIIDEQTVRTGNQYRVDDVPFTTSLRRGDHTGPATLEFYLGTAQQPAERITLDLTEAAG